MKKKIIMGLGDLTAAVAPIATLVACAGNKEQNKEIQDKIILKKNAKEISGWHVAQNDDQLTFYIDIFDDENVKINSNDILHYLEIECYDKGKKQIRNFSNDATLFLNDQQYKSNQKINLETFYSKIEASISDGGFIKNIIIIFAKQGHISIEKPRVLNSSPELKAKGFDYEYINFSRLENKGYESFDSKKEEFESTFSGNGKLEFNWGYFDGKEPGEHAVVITDNGNNQIESAKKPQSIKILIKLPYKEINAIDGDVDIKRHYLKFFSRNKYLKDSEMTIKKGSNITIDDISKMIEGYPSTSITTKNKQEFSTDIIQDIILSVEDPGINGVQEDGTIIKAKWEVFSITVHVVDGKDFENCQDGLISLKENNPQIGKHHVLKMSRDTTTNFLIPDEAYFEDHAPSLKYSEWYGVLAPIQKYKSKTDSSLIDGGIEITEQMLLNAFDAIGKLKLQKNLVQSKILLSDFKIKFIQSDKIVDFARYDKDKLNYDNFVLDQYDKDSKIKFIAQLVDPGKPGWNEKGLFVYEPQTDKKYFVIYLENIKYLLKPSVKIKANIDTAEINVLLKTDNGGDEIVTIPLKNTSDLRKEDFSFSLPPEYRQQYIDDIQDVSNWQRMTNDRTKWTRRKHILDFIKENFDIEAGEVGEIEVTMDGNNNLLINIYVEGFDGIDGPKWNPKYYAQLLPEEKKAKRIKITITTSI